jgi:hypothetical protein
MYKAVILPVVLYGCETWFLTLSEEHRLRVFENTVLRRIFVYHRTDCIPAVHFMPPAVDVKLLSMCIVD